MIITLKQNKFKYSVKTEADDLKATEILETFTNLMKCAGWQQDSINEAIMALNEEIEL